MVVFKSGEHRILFIKLINSNIATYGVKSRPGVGQAIAPECFGILGRKVRAP